MIQGIETVVLLFVSNIFMTLAWYGHLRLQQSGVSSNWPLMGVVVFSWGIAFFEYCFQVPANRLGFSGNGGPFSLVQLKRYPGVRVADSLCHCRQYPLSGSDASLESCGGVPLPRRRSLFCVHGVSLMVVSNE